MNDKIFYYLLPILATILFIYKHFIATNNKNNLPPSPPSLPILGHLHLLKGGVPIHLTIQGLAERYGPVFALRLGRKPVVVVSAPRIVEECFTQNDIIFSNRPMLMAGEHLGYNHSILFWTRYGGHWKNLRRVVTGLALSGKKIIEMDNGRKEEVHCLIKELLQFGGGATKVNLSELFGKVVRNFVMRVMNGKRWEYEYKPPDEPFSSMCDFLPILRWVGYKGEERKMIEMGREREEFLKGLIGEVNMENRETSEGQKRKTMIEELLDLHEHDPHVYTLDVVKGIILVMLFGGTHTSTRVLEWTMSLLLSHAEVLNKARSEIDTQVGNARIVNENDLSKLKYIRCIIKESMRLFHPSPLLVPRCSSQDCTIAGYHVKKGTTLFVNAWVIHRDPKLWEEPTKFTPERFMKDNKQGFNKFIPFGMGKRTCPGDRFALRNITWTLASLIQCFDWKMDEDYVDLSGYENSLLITSKEKSLEVTCNPRSFMNDVLSKM